MLLQCYYRHSRDSSRQEWVLGEPKRSRARRLRTHRWSTSRSGPALRSRSSCTCGTPVLQWRNQESFELNLKRESRAAASSIIAMNVSDCVSKVMNAENIWEGKTIYMNAGRRWNCERTLLQGPTWSSSVTKFSAVEWTVMPLLMQGERTTEEQAQHHEREFRSMWCEKIWGLTEHEHPKHCE